jgi:hypothetical protein
MALADARTIKFVFVNYFGACTYLVQHYLRTKLVRNSVGNRFTRECHNPVSKKYLGHAPNLGIKAAYL